MKSAAVVGKYEPAKVLQFVDAMQAGAAGNRHVDEQEELDALRKDVESAAHLLDDPILPAPEHESLVGESPGTARTRVQRRSDPQQSGAVADLGARLAAAAGDEEPGMDLDMRHAEAADAGEDGRGTARAAGQRDSGMDGEGFEDDVGGDGGWDEDEHPPVPYGLLD